MQSVPRFTQHPQSQSAYVGDTVTLVTQVNGVDPISYQWFLNNLALPQSSSLTLTLSNVAPNMAGGYFLVASNANGTATSAVAYLAILQHPGVTTITQQPQSQTIALGTTANFSLGVSGDGPFTYQWRKNGVPIQNAVTSTFSILSVATSDAANYTATVNYPGGSLTSQTATLIVSAIGASSATRQITRSGANFFASVSISPPNGTPAYLVEELIPPGFTVRDISNSGTLDVPNNKVAWGPFWDGIPRTLTYTLVPAPSFVGTATLSGAAIYLGGTVATDGDKTIRILPTDPTSLGLSMWHEFFVITVNGVVGSTYRLEATSDLSNGSWTPIILFTLPTSPWSYIDAASAGQTNRYYRTVLLE